MNKNIKDLINDQINKELYSSYIYLNIANFYEEKGLNGFASWFNKQAKEEIEHAQKFIKYLHDEDESVTLLEINAPTQKFNDLKEPLLFQLAHEKYVTSLINSIYEASIEAKDYRTTSFLNWFIDEQAEEERNAKTLISQYELYVEDKENHGIRNLDQALSQRK